MLTLVSFAPPSPGSGRAEVPDSPPAMAEAFLGLLAEAAPEDAQKTASTTTETAPTDDQEDSDSANGDAAITLFMGVPMVPPPPPPVKSGDAPDAAEVQSGSAIPAKQPADSRILPEVSAQVGALSKSASRVQAKAPEEAKPAPLSAPAIATRAEPSTEPLTTDVAALPNAPRGAMESAARFRLDEAAEVPTDDPATLQVEISGDAPFTAPVSDMRPDQRPADQALLSPHKQAAGHLTKLLTETGTQLTTHANRSELTLAPEELGRIKFDIRQHGDSLVVTLTADRPETLDLMRRHANDLRSELAAAGYGGATLDFAGSDERHRPSQGPDTAAPLEHFTDLAPAPPEQALSPAFQRSVATDGLDLRL